MLSPNRITRGPGVDTLPNLFGRPSRGSAVQPALLQNSGTLFLRSLPFLKQKGQPMKTNEADPLLGRVKEQKKTISIFYFCIFLPRCCFGEVVFSDSCDKKKGSSLLHPDIPLVSYLVTPPGVVSFRQQQYTSTAPSAKLPWSVTKVTKVNMREPKKLPSFTLTAQMVLLIEDILHQLIGGLSNCIYP